MAHNITSELKKKLTQYLKENPKSDLVTTYLFFLEEKYHLKPVLFPKEKLIYQSLDSLTEALEKKNQLWRETELLVPIAEVSVTEETKKIFICPFTGKVFADNLYPNPEDAIYDWVSKCPENTERVDGLKAKRFFVSDDPEIIKGYLTSNPTVKKKKVFSSAITSKLFHSKESVIEDFKKNHVKYLTLQEVQNQNRFQIEEKFLHFLQEYLEEEKVAAFVEELSQDESFKEHVLRWLG